MSTEHATTLFDGETLNGWESTGNTDGWVVEDGLIFCKAEKGGYLYYTGDQYKNLELSLEFRHEAKANSGVFFRWTDLENPVQTGIEIQILDTYAREPATVKCCGAVYDVQGPTHNTCKPAGEWNLMVLNAMDNRIYVTLNGEQIVDMDLDRWTTPGQNPDGTPNKFKRAFREMVEPGYIGLQDHGGKLWFRNITVRKL